MAKLKTSAFLIKNSVCRPIKKISDEDKKIMSERLEKVLSEYYTQHPDEFLKIKI